MFTENSTLDEIRNFYYFNLKTNKKFEKVFRSNDDNLGNYYKRIVDILLEEFHFKDETLRENKEVYNLLNLLCFSNLIEFNDTYVQSMLQQFILKQALFNYINYRFIF